MKTTRWIVLVVAIACAATSFVIVDETEHVIVTQFGRPTAVYSDAGLLDATSFRVAALSVPLMIGATFAGRHLNASAGERGYRWMFWTVMGGYTARVLSTL